MGKRILARLVTPPVRWDKHEVHAGGPVSILTLSAEMVKHPNEVPNTLADGVTVGTRESLRD